MSMMPNGRIATDDLEDALDMMEPLYLGILEQVKNILPGPEDSADDSDVRPYVMAVMGALAKATGAVIDSVYQPICHVEVIKRHVQAVIEALRIFHEEANDVPENQ